MCMAALNGTQDCPNLLLLCLVKSVLCALSHHDSPGSLIVREIWNQTARTMSHSYDWWVGAPSTEAVICCGGSTVDEWRIKCFQIKYKSINQLSLVYLTVCLLSHCKWTTLDLLMSLPAFWPSLLWLETSSAGPPESPLDVGVWTGHGSLCTAAKSKKWNWNQTQVQITLVTSLSKPICFCWAHQFVDS